MSDINNALRRSSRIKAKVRETSDNEDCSESVTNKRDKAGRSFNSSDDERACVASYKPELEKELETIEKSVQKSTELFAADDVSANRYYGFATAGGRNISADKSMLKHTSGKTLNPKEPLGANTTPDTTEATSKASRMPSRAIRNAPVSGRKRIVSGSMSSESETVSEDSEFVPSDDGESNATDDDFISENGTDNSNNDEDTNDQRVSRAVKLPIRAISSEFRGTPKKSMAYSDFHLKTDEYFTSQSAKVLTSDRTLARLRADPRSDNDQSEKSLRNLSQTSGPHTRALYGLNKNYILSFAMWNHIMEEGYSLLLHGLGSKRDLINNFYHEIVTDHPTLIVNGFFPSLNVKDILDGIVAELLGRESLTNFDESFNLIEQTLMNSSDNDRLYLLIHNIDAEMLRGEKAQDTLSRLAAMRNVRVLASVDHINAPLLWDNVKRSRYNFYWFDATTLLPYKAETSYESSLLVQRSGTLALSSLYNVFQSLTTNTKAIYIILVNHQLENGNNHGYPGMAFKDLYQCAREGFLVSSDLALRAQLTEFIDHKLVKTKRNVDGAEYLVIPLNNALLRNFIDQQNEN